jgi:hypothetical protein
MLYYVSMKQSDTPFSFTTNFTSDEADAILGAVVGQRFDLEDGFGNLFDDGHVIQTLKSIGGQSFNSLNYAELCRQLRTHELD